ncbi:MAG: threonine synthase [Endomicrobia bacterium]|nr:threonine synthase [Endomicrobiia bacterium]
MNFYFKCIVCEKEFNKDEVEYTCPECSNNLEVLYDYEKIRERFLNNLNRDKKFTLWRYLPLLPLTSKSEVFNKIQIFATPIVKSVNISKKFGLKKLYFKDDTKLPSGSLKDRASAVVVAYALQNNKRKIITASTGNAGCALACISAMVGLKPIIVVPKTAPVSKLLQIVAYGAKIVKYDGTYDDCFDYVLKLCDENKDFFNRSTGINPFTREGKKTVSFEIWEQMGYKVPDMIFVPIGDGNIISGVWKGFKELYYCRLTKKLPILIGVQSAKSNAIKLTFDEIKKKIKHNNLSEILHNIKVKKIKATTIADSISVDLPRDCYAAVKAVLESKGDIVEVEDKEIVLAVRILASNEGIFAEPAAAASVAGLLRYLKYNHKNLTDKLIIALITGHGLKDTRSITCKL